MEKRIKDEFCRWESVVTFMSGTDFEAHQYPI